MSPEQARERNANVHLEGTSVVGAGERSRSGTEPVRISRLVMTSVLRRWRWARVLGSFCPRSIWVRISLVSYRSEAADSFQRDQLAAPCDQASRNNRGLKVTGSFCFGAVSLSRCSRGIRRWSASCISASCKTSGTIECSCSRTTRSNRSSSPVEHARDLGDELDSIESSETASPQAYDHIRRSGLRSRFFARWSRDHGRGCGVFHTPFARA